MAGPVVGWKEVARTAIPNDVLVQPWCSSSAVARVTTRGNRVTCGYCLDKLWPAEDHHRIDPQDAAACGLTREQFAEGKAKGLPHAIRAVIEPLRAWGRADRLPWSADAQFRNQLLAPQHANRRQPED